jgi:hypothetical protein
MDRSHLSCNTMNTQQYSNVGIITSVLFSFICVSFWYRFISRLILVVIMNNQTLTLLPAELFFSLGRLAAIFSLLFIVVLVLVIIFLLFFQQRNTSVFDEHELASETDPTVIENKTLELANVKQYASTHNNPSMTTAATSTNSFYSEVNEEKTQSTTSLISSK